MGHDVSLCAQELWEDIEAVRRTGPLVHNITNLVVMSLSANVLRAAGASPYRNRTLAELLDVGVPAVIRGNGSEIMSTANTAIKTRGVDSSASADDALDAARALAARIAGTVCVSGATDHIVHADGRHARLSNGHVWMTRITGVGCSLSALIGALCTVQSNAWRATVAGMAWMGIAGEIAAAKAQHMGIGSMAVLLLDAVHQLHREEFIGRLKLSVADN